LKSGEECAVIDPGGDGPLILERLKEVGGRVLFVIDTHGHIDHVLANGAVVDGTGAELLIHELDAGMLTAPDANLAFMMEVEVRSPEASRFLAEGDRLVIGDEELTVLHTPGHTPGSICLVGKGFAFTGDTLFLDSIGRTDLPGGSERMMQHSLSRLQATLNRETQLYPGHGEPGSFGRALLINPFLGSIWPA
ncbi:MAG: MBL fold metallo-hydrolase, partial [candidate division WOR-3 bacterium]